MLNKKYMYIAGLIVLLSMVMRMLGGTKTYYWASDIARDFMVGSHIREYHERPLVGHLAAGFGEAFYYPPYIYYQHAILQTVFQTPESLIGYFVFLDAVCLVIFFYVALMLFGIESAVFSSLGIAISAIMVDASRYMNVSPGLPLIYIAALLCIYAVKKQSVPYITLSCCIVTLASMHHLSALLYCPIFYMYWLVTNRNWSKLNAVLPLFFTISLFLVLLSPLYVYYGLYEVLRHLVPSATFGTPLIDSVKKCVYILQQFSSNVFPYMRHFGEILSILLLIFTAGIYKKKLSEFFPLIAMVGIILLVISTISQMKSVFNPIFFTYFYPMFFLIVGHTFGLCWKQVKSSSIGSALCILLFSMFIFSTSNKFEYVYTGQSLGIHQPREVARRIHEYVKKRTIESPQFSKTFRLYVTGPEAPIWGTPTVLYFLEELQNHQLVRISASSTSIEQLNSDIHIFVVCRYLSEEFFTRWNMNQQQWSTPVCIDTFLKKFPEYKKYSIMEIPELSAYDARIFLLSQTQRENK